MCVTGGETGVPDLSLERVEWVVTQQVQGVDFLFGDSPVVVSYVCSFRDSCSGFSSSM